MFRFYLQNGQDQQNNQQQMLRKMWVKVSPFTLGRKEKRLSYSGDKSRAPSES